MFRIVGTTSIEVTTEDLFGALKRSVMGHWMDHYELGGKVYKDIYDPRSGNYIRVNDDIRGAALEKQLELIRAFATIEKHIN